MTERIAIVSGARTPMAKAHGPLRDIPADDLGAFAVKEAVSRAGIDPTEYNEVIVGNVAHPPDAPNIARVIALKAGLPRSLPAYTVHRNCASGMEAITSAAAKLLLGEAEIVIAGGTESMSQVPLMFGSEYTEFLTRVKSSKTLRERLRALASFRPRLLKPETGVTKGLTDPIIGMMMGDTAELLAREFRITRHQQDEYALLSHRRAVAAREQGLFTDEIIPIPILPQYAEIQLEDYGPRRNQTIEQLAKLKPYFNRHTGTVTAGNSSPISDGAAALTLMRESSARERGVEPLGYLRAYAYAALAPQRMGLGPAYATARMFGHTGAELQDFDVIELNEGFAAVVIANELAFRSEAFAREYLNRMHALGEIDRERLNPQGGAISLGHPVGMTGTRLVLHLLLELRRRRANTGLATLCVGGGQGAAMMLEVA